MKLLGLSFLFVTAAGLGWAQQWEFGGVGGAGFLSNVSVTSSVGAATTGFQTGGAAGAFLGYNSTTHIGGELRYAFLQSNMQIQSGGSQATFSGQAHVLHYDVIFHTNRHGSKGEFFLALA